MRLNLERLPPEIAPLTPVDVLKIAAGALAVLIVLAGVFHLSIEVPTLALVAASFGVVGAYRVWSRRRLGHWASAAAILSTLLCGFFYFRHVDGSVARERQAVANAKLIRDTHEAAAAEREAQNQATREAAAQEERRRRKATEEAERLEHDRGEAVSLATLRRTHPDRYLERIKATDIDLWLKEAKLLRPALYEAYLKQQNRKKQGTEYTDAKLSALDRLKLTTILTPSATGNRPVATFIITSVLPFSVQNLRVQCDSGGARETPTWTKTIALREVVPPSSTKRFVNIKLGPIPAQMSEPVCKIVGAE